MFLQTTFTVAILAARVYAGSFYPRNPYNNVVPDVRRRAVDDPFLDELAGNMTIAEIVSQLHLMFSNNLAGPASDNSYYPLAMHLAPDAGVGIVHDWYPTNTSQYNDLQELNIERSRLGVPLMQTGECLHGVGSYKQSMFPQAIGLAASFDEDLVYRVGRAIGKEARSIGIHACFSPVLDLGKEPRWGRVQEAWGEDHVLTSHLGVAFSSGLSKNSSWWEPDAVVPVMKHFAAHGRPRAGINAAPYTGSGTRQVMMEDLIPFRDVVQRGGAKGVMMAYHELDSIPAHVHPMLYDALDEWGFDGFTLADDTGMRMLYVRHTVSDSPGDTIQQWFNAGGMVQFYDYTFDEYLNVTTDLVSNRTVAEDLLRSKARRVLSVKSDLGLFDEPYIPSDIDPQNIVAEHAPLTLEAAHKSIVLLENKNQTLPIRPKEQGIKKIALVGPFLDQFNYGDYSGAWGSLPVGNATTIREAMVAHLQEEEEGRVELVSSWGANTWLYNAQYPIPPYLMSPPSSNRTGGMKATYYRDPDFGEVGIEKDVEPPTRDWGMYPPEGLPSNNFSVVWEGVVRVPVDADVDGWIGVAVYPNTTAKLYINDSLVVEARLTAQGNILGNIQQLSYVSANATAPPPGTTEWTFTKDQVLDVRIEYRALNLWQKYENVNSLNAQVSLLWSLVDRADPVGKALEVAKDADLIALAVGAAWNSDGESGDRATLGLSVPQTALSDAIFALNKPVVIILEGGRPFAIPEYYEKAAGVIDAFFPGQMGGQAISDVLFGKFSPGGRVPLSVPYSAASLPVYYNFHFTAHARNYTDIYSYPMYSFGYGLSYTNFSQSNFSASSKTFSAGDTITFSVDVTNEGSTAGSYLAQVYLLVRVSTIVRPQKQLVAFQRVYLEPGEIKQVEMQLEVNRFLPIVNRRMEWVLEGGDYTFALLEHSGYDADTSRNVTLTCV